MTDYDSARPADNLQGVFADGYWLYLPLSKHWVFTDDLRFNCYWGA